MAVRKSRTWWFVQRLDLLPDDWQEQLEGLMIPGCYIVHDCDTKTDVETGLDIPVAPHVHCILSFTSSILFDTVIDYLPDSFGVKMVKPVPNKVGAYRYLMHYGYDDKHQYARDLVRHMNGFKISMSDVYNVDFTDVYEFIEKFKITNFAVLCSFAVEYAPDMMNYIASHANLIKTYIQERNRL